MKFLSSAIKFTPKNGSPMIVYGKRHWNCLEQMYKMGIDRDKSKDIQGFIILIDGLETFVDRSVGADIAKELGYKLEYENTLFSEDIWAEEEN